MFEPEETFLGRVQSYSGGYERDLVRAAGLNVGLGPQVSLFHLNSEMKGAYGNSPKAMVVFLRLRPLGNVADHMRMMNGH